MGVSTCFAERRTALCEARNKVQKRKLTNVRSRRRTIRSSHVQRLFQRGAGRLLGLKWWMARHARRKRLTAQLCKAAVMQWACDEHDETAASVLSEASTAPEELSNLHQRKTLAKVDDHSATMWDEVFSKGQQIAPVKYTENGATVPTKAQGACVAIDCEMVGVGRAKARSILARVAVVDENGATLLDEFVRPTERITDFRTKWSGIRPKDLVGAPAFSEVRARVAALVRGKILIGHAVANDLRVLSLPHPPMLTRDTSLYPPLRMELDRAVHEYNPANAPSLKNLSLHLLGKKIQDGEHCPVQDAYHTMQLYLRHRAEWEAEMLS